MFKKLFLVFLFCVLSPIAKADTTITAIQTSCIETLGIFRISFNHYYPYYKYDESITSESTTRLAQKQNIYLNPSSGNHTCQLGDQKIELVYFSPASLDSPKSFSLKINDKPYIKDLLIYNEAKQKRLNLSLIHIWRCRRS